MCAPSVGMTPWASDLWVACVVFRMTRVFVCVFLARLYARGSACNLQAPAAPFAAGIRHSDQQRQSGLLQYGRPLRPNANIRTYNLQRVGCPLRSLKTDLVRLPGQCLWQIRGGMSV